MNLIKFVLFTCLFISSQSFAAVNAAVVWEVRTTGSANNGGGFKTGATGTDYSQQDAAQYALTGLTSAGVGNVILTASAATDMVGNIIHIVSGTNFTVGFFEITSVSAGVSITVSTTQAGTAVTTGVGATGVGNIGGAFAFGTNADATMAAGIAPGNKVWIKAGNHAGFTTSTSFTDCTNANPCTIAGYSSARADEPTGSSRPVVNAAGAQILVGALTLVKNLNFTGTNAAMLTSDGQDTWFNVKATNTSTTSSRIAMNPGGGDLILNCEAVSQNGTGIQSSGTLTILGSYVHDSNIGIKQGASSETFILNNIIAGNVTAGMNFGTSQTVMGLVSGNTIYGAENKLGTGITLTGASGGDVKILNNILYGLATGISGNSNFGYSNYNDLFNNTSDRSNWTTGASDVAVDPGFSNVVLINGTAGVISGSTLTDSGKSFSNVVDNQDYVYISGGTGVTQAMYLITSHTTTVLTLASAPGGSGSNITYRVRTGNNYQIGPNVRNKAFPGLFPASYTTGFLSVGAVQQMPGYPRGKGTK